MNNDGFFCRDCGWGAWSAPFVKVDGQYKVQCEDCGSDNLKRV